MGRRRPAGSRMAAALALLDAALLITAEVVPSAAAAASACTVRQGVVLGSACTKQTCTLDNKVCASPAECCDLCGSTEGCTTWTFEPAAGESGRAACFLKSSAAGPYEPRAGAVSGCLSAADCPTPPPPPQPDVSVLVDTSAVLSRTDDGFKCWNIDASPNREWETRDLSSPLLASLGRQSLPGYLRFGGAGNDGLPSTCPTRAVTATAAPRAATGAASTARGPTTSPTSPAALAPSSSSA